MRISTLVAGALALGVASTAAPARAFDESTRGPFYVQGELGAFGVWADLPVANTLVYWHPDVEFGVHFTGRHDGPVIGIRQGFDVGRSADTIGQTVLRGGYDMAFPFRNGRFELTVAPFGTVGINYFFDGPQSGRALQRGPRLEALFLPRASISSCVQSSSPWASS